MSLVKNYSLELKRYPFGIFNVFPYSPKILYAQKKHYFWFGEVRMDAMLAGVFVVPIGFFLEGRAKISLAFISVAILFLPLFVFLPKLIQRGLHADVDIVIDAFGNNEQVKKVFWSLFVVMAGLVLAKVMDPVTAQQVVGMITGGCDAWRRRKEPPPLTPIFNVNGILNPQMSD